MRIVFLVAGCLAMSTLLVSCCAAEVTEKQETAPEVETAELQARGNGSVDLVSDPVHDGARSARLALPENYSPGDAARIAVALDGLTLSDITGLSYWCCVDAETPANEEGYWVPYLTFEIDTDGEPGCDTWVIGGRGPVSESPGVWFGNTMESDWLFHVSSAVAGYETPFPLNAMGTLTEIKEAMGPDGTTPLGDCTVSKVRLAIGNWGPGGPAGPVICYVDYLICNGRLLF